MHTSNSAPATPTTSRPPKCWRRCLKVPGIARRQLKVVLADVFLREHQRLAGDHDVVLAELELAEVRDGKALALAELDRAFREADGEMPGDVRFPRRVPQRELRENAVVEITAHQVGIPEPRDDHAALRPGVWP